jgi:hypothetical protein
VPAVREAGRVVSRAVKSMSRRAIAGDCVFVWSMALGAVGLTAVADGLAWSVVWPPLVAGALAGVFGTVYRLSLIKEQP